MNHHFTSLYLATTEPVDPAYPPRVMLAIWSAALLFCAAGLAGVAYCAWRAFEILAA